MNSGRPLADAGGAAVKQAAQWGKADCTHTTFVQQLARGQTLLLSFEPPPFGLNRISTDPGGQQRLSCRVRNWVKALIAAEGHVEMELFKSLQLSDCVRIQGVVFMGQAQ